MGARYDGVADWYDENFSYLGRPDGTGGALVRLVGPADGTVCIDVGCGTGLHLRALQEAGHVVVGCDISADQLRLAQRRCPRVLQADAARLPLASGSVGLVVATFIHTDVDDWEGVVREAVRILRRGGRFVYLGLHPCFVGHFADRTAKQDARRVVLVEGYGDRKLLYTGVGANVLRSKVGGRHVSLAAFLQAFIDAGLILRRIEELSQVVVPGEPAVESERAAWLT